MNWRVFALILLLNPFSWNRFRVKCRCCGEYFLEKSLADEIIEWVFHK
jgi:hypothetical protein